MRSILAFFSLMLLAFANYSLEDFNQNRLNEMILKRLDIDPSFLNSKNFLIVKKRYQHLKKRHMIDPKRVETYFIPALVKLINDYDIPDIFLFMALAESNFALHAKSSKRAIGIWQFMPATARKYGLRVDEFVDERKDPYKSTKAAIAYLKDLYNKFGKWYLAALAYNAGAGAVQRAIKKAGSDDLVVLIDPDKKYLSKESRIYICKIAYFALLANQRGSILNEDLFYILTRGEDYSIVPVYVKGAESLEYVGEKIRLRYSYLKKLNPHIKRGFTPPGVKKYSIYIPQPKLKDFKKFYKPSNGVQNFLVYRVKKGDSFYKIAKRFHTKVSLIKKFNKKRSNMLHIGETLVLPILKSHKQIYRVRSGDTLIKIAKQFHVKVEDIRRWNNKKGSLLKKGEKLVVVY